MPANQPTTNQPLIVRQSPYISLLHLPRVTHPSFGEMKRREEKLGIREQGLVSPLLFEAALGSGSHVGSTIYATITPSLKCMSREDPCMNCSVGCGMPR